jgi:NitT/TauT family transport system substrate-binding protein
MNRRTWVAVAATAAIAVAACSPSQSPAPSGGASASPGASPAGSPGASAAVTTIRVQLPGRIDGEFAGYIAAQKLGYFADDNLAVKLIPSDPNPASRPATYYRPGASGPEFTVSDVASVLAAREHGSDLVDIAQIFQRSGTVVMSWKKDGIADVCGLKGKKVGLWPSPADAELASSLKACSLTASDYTRVGVGQDASELLGHTVDASQGQIFDQVARVLEATNPATGKQYTVDDLATFGPSDRQSTLQDAIFVSAEWLKATGHRDVAVGFVRAVVRGWLYCRDHQEDCVQFTVQGGTNLGASHTRWMINEVDALIWPSPDGIGTLDPIQWQQTITVATTAGIITKSPGLAAYDNSIVPDAVAILEGKDLSATDYKKVPVAVAPGGK